MYCKTNEADKTKGSYCLLNVFFLFLPLSFLKKKKSLRGKVNGDEALGTVNTCNIEIKVRLGLGENV